MMAPDEGEIVLVGLERPALHRDLKAVRAGIGAALQALYSDILREELTDRIAELVQQLDQRLKQLDQQKDTGGTERR
jgi:hypothetical protein